MRLHAFEELHTLHEASGGGFVSFVNEGVTLALLPGCEIHRFLGVVFGPSDVSGVGPFGDGVDILHLVPVQPLLDDWP